MKGERLSQIEDIYHAVLEVSEDEWPSFLANSCSGDDELRLEVESLLSFSNKPHSLIDVPPLDVAAELVRDNNRPNIVGKKIKHYRILEHIGTGGMGDVFLARDTVLERNVAIKFVSKQFSRDDAGLRRFLREAKAASSLNHPNIITVHEVGKTKDTPFIATEFIEGRTLRSLIDEGDLTEKKAIDVASQVASALVAAHTAGILHRDIKPENIMVRADDLVKVLDFGLAKVAGSPSIDTKNIPHTEQTDPQLSVPGSIMGTLAYMSPEQAAGKATDERSDIWSLGVVLFEMLTGKKPFDRVVDADSILSIPIDRKESMVAEVPTFARSLFGRMLAIDPDERYANASELLIDLKTLDDAQVRPEPRTAGDFAALLSPKAIAVTAAILLVSIVTIAGYLYRSSPPRPINSIAILPFANQDVGKDSEHLSDGISETLINELSQLRGLKVIARSSTFRYKGQNVDIDQLARELGVEAIVTGTVSHSEDAVHVTVGLVNVNDKAKNWKGNFSRSVSNFGQVEAEILNELIDKLEIKDGRKGRQKIAEVKNVDPRVYELLLKGRFFHSKGTYADADRAIEYFQQALAIDPTYALAHAALANSNLYIGVNGFVDPIVPMANAESSARRALELDSNLAEVHLAVAGIRQFSWDWAEAEREYQMAIDLSPNFALAHFRYSLFLSTQGKHAKALTEMRIARELDPLRRGVNFDLGYVHYFSRQYDAANEQYAIGIELDPVYGGGYYGRGLLRLAQGDYANAIDDFNVFISLNGQHTGVDCYLGTALARAGRTNEARSIARRLETSKDYVSPVEFAILRIGLGENEKALDTLERAYSARDPQMQYLVIEPNFDSIRSEPRFVELVRKVGLP